MSQKVDCPVVRWPGHILLHDYLTLPQVMAWRRAWRAAETFTREGETPDAPRIIEDALEYRAALLPGVLPCVEKFALVGLPEKLTLETFPGSPVEDAIELANWLMLVIANAIRGEELVPKA